MGNISFDDIEYDKSKKLVYNKNTGELYDTSEENLKHLLEIKKIEDEQRRAKENELKRLAKGDKKEDLKYNWMLKTHFIKEYRVEGEWISRQVNITRDESMLLSVFGSRIEYMSNRVVLHGGGNMTNNKIMELTGMGKNSVAKALKGLEEKHYIKRVGKTSSREIYYNPYLKSSGNEMSKNTIKLFSEYAKMRGFK